jgi:hypothetical protein
MGQVWGPNDKASICTIKGMVNQGGIWGLKSAGGPGRKPQWQSSAVELDG